jgi:hypothetical protein
MRAAIIPLGHGSHRDSSSLPEGFQSTIAFATVERSAFDLSNADSSSRAGSPLLFGLAPRGVFRAPGVTTGAVGSYPTFSPLPNVACMWSPGLSPAPLEDVPQVSLRDATVLRSAGGLFSVALSVAQPHRTGLNPMPHAEARNSALRQSLRGKPPDVIRRVALSRVPSIIPPPPRGVCTMINVPQDDVRTFLPPRRCSGGFTPPLLPRNQRSPGPPAIFIIHRRTYGICTCSEQK